MATTTQPATGRVGPSGQPTGPVDGPPPGRKSAGPLALLEQIADMLILAWRTLIAVFTPPYSWRDEFIEETWIIIRRCAIPLMISATAFGFGAPGLQGGNLVGLLGTIDRLGSFFVMASVREFAPWITGMVVAGIGGTAVCADLGARKVRQELDAMITLGLDPVRTIVAPRFLALGIVTAAMNLIAIIMGVVGGWLAAVVVFGETSAGYFSTFTSNFTVPDLLGSVLKTTLFGFIVAVVCCYKGMHTKGGAEGVGRAVNQAVVISFVAIWAFNYVFTTTLLAAFPETGSLR
ncbi:MAG: MlaE family ABC transporter permease [Solirubrobacteraceae bacterium]